MSGKSPDLAINPVCQSDATSRPICRYRSRDRASTIIRKRVVLHGALGYAAEAGLLPDNPLESIAWHVPESSAALDPPPLRPAPRRPVTVAERRRGPRPDRRPGREQRRGPAHRLHPLHPRPRRPPQPADQPNPRAGPNTWSVPVRGKPAVAPDRATPRKLAATPTTRRAPKPSAMRPWIPHPAHRRPADPRRHQADAPRNSTVENSLPPCSKREIEQESNSGPIPRSGPQLAQDPPPTVREPLATARKSR